MNFDKNEESKRFFQEVKLARHDELNGLVKSGVEGNFKAVIMMGQSSIKSVLIINAGATIAFLAFFSSNIGIILQNDESYIVLCRLLVWAVLSWGIGTILASMAYGVTYLTQSAYAAHYGQQVNQLMLAFWNNQAYTISPCKQSIMLQKWAIGLVVLSYICMSVGMIISFVAFNELLS